MRIKTFYNKNYYAKTPTASMRKLPIIARDAEQAGFVQLIDPFEVYKGDIIGALMQLHDPDYVRQFVSGRGELKSSQGFTWSKQIRDGVLSINAGMLAGAITAFDTGISANIAQGFHHAEFKQGAGFCTFNGLALAAQEFPKKRIMVIDCDEHQGNGTMDFLKHLPNLYNFTIYGSHFGGYTKSIRNREAEFKHPITNNWDMYMDAVMIALGTALEVWKPDLIIYQAGADPHIDDPLGTLKMTTEQMFERDKTVFEFCRDFSIPCLFVMAGGYQDPIHRTVRLHVNTFRAASEIYKEEAQPDQWEVAPSEYLATLTLSNHTRKG
jgi:acetoin utilization deacetylase AcuC-like enzyme